MRRHWSLLGYPVGPQYNAIMAYPLQENWPKDTLLYVGGVPLIIPSPGRDYLRATTN